MQKLFRIIVAILSICFLIFSVANFWINYDAEKYIEAISVKSRIYEDYYVKPESVQIGAGEAGTKNLICIYLESMENAYSSKEFGGNQETNLIPNLTELAEENISFSNTETLGGFYEASGASWTVAALFASTSGTQLKYSIQKAAEPEGGLFAPDVVSLGDILEEKGYVQEFLCGSDGDYACRASYFEQHGNYEIFDLYTAREKNYIEDDYYVWWGYEDKYLFEIAKDELKKLSEGDDLFNFTMLTVDTHYPDGYVCDLCDDEYEKDIENVIKCADTQVYEFVQWCKEQEFYEDTVIVLLGDHARMDTQLMEGFETTDRTIYNCIINSGKEKSALKLTNREYVSMDLFPTILSAMGFEIEGDRLGLGTDLFSGRKTIMEEIGKEQYLYELTNESVIYYDLVR